VHIDRGERPQFDGRDDPQTGVHHGQCGRCASGDPFRYLARWRAARAVGVPERRPWFSLRQPVYPQFAQQAEAVRHLSIRGHRLEDSPKPLPEIEELARTTNILKAFAAMAGSLIDGT